MLPMSLRTAETERIYQDAKKRGDIVPLHDEKRIEDFKYWCIVENRFPYDVSYKKCHLLIPKREGVIYFNDINFDEFIELGKLIEEGGFVESNYDEWKVNTKKKRSNMVLFHIHLNSFYDSREEMRL